MDEEEVLLFEFPKKLGEEMEQVNIRLERIHPPIYLEENRRTNLV